jgi:hypothetical protein
MADSIEAIGPGGGPEGAFTLHLVLREGFRQHRVLVVMDGRAIYQAGSVTTDAITATADARDVTSTSRHAHLVVSVMPGNLAAAFDIDIAARPYLGISLVGANTIASETSALPFR